MLLFPWISANPGEESRSPVLDASTLDTLRDADVPDADEEKSEFLTGLVRTFQERGQCLLEDFKEAAHQNDLDCVRKCAHKMRGSAASLGAERLAETCRQIEEGNIEQGNELASKVSEVEDEFIEVCQLLDKEL